MVVMVSWSACLSVGVSCKWNSRSVVLFSNYNDARVAADGGGGGGRTNQLNYLSSLFPLSLLRGSRKSWIFDCRQPQGGEQSLPYGVALTAQKAIDSDGEDATK